jgi:menaquinone-9 beta-reductase
MDTFDVLIAGGGPAGSSCAWKLRDSGLKIAILDKQTFPRDKVCGGWITPEVFHALNIDPAEYARGRVLQPITGFLTSCMGDAPVETHYDKPVSYGIRRYEFDHYLLERSGASLRLGAPLTNVERCHGEWIINGQIRAPMLVGAGGTFCPVARFRGAKVNQEIVVAAQEAEFELDERQLSACSVRAEVPELYFCSDMRGYGWCFRKQNVLNVGLGRLDRHSLSGHVAEFVKFLKSTGRLTLDVPALPGHAYLLYGKTNRELVDDGLLLIGDAAGVAYAQSGEGIRPAVESGLLAANVIAAAEGSYSRERLEPYRALLVQRFGKSENHWAARLGGHVPAGLMSAVARKLLSTHWFSREIVLDRWFLHRHEPALNC